jgi:hypothetical protein
LNKKKKWKKNFKLLFATDKICYQWYLHSD